ncbi:MAG TPA: ABC transporter ATP-binding protein [Allosphingosinicella sp.]|jgi:ATP-binding cassette subfamily B protein
METLRTLYATMSPRRRRQFALTVVAMLGGALAELVTIGAVFPFLAVLTQGHGKTATLSRLPLPRVDSAASAALILVAAALTAAAVRLGLLWMTQRLVTGFAHDLARAMFARMLRQPYADYVRRNSSEALAAMEKARDVAGQVLQPLMQAAIATIMALFIAVFLFILSPVAALGAGLSLALVYFAISRLTRDRLSANSRILSASALERVKIVQEALGGLRDIILDRSHAVFEEEFAATDARMRRALANNSLISQGPRFAIEAAGIVAIALVALWMSSRPGGIVAAIPVLGALALGSQRLLPLLQQAYLGWSGTLGNRQALADIAALLSAPALTEPSEGAGKLPFRDGLAFRGVSFAYAGGGQVLRGVDLDMKAGARIGIVGPTGSGKSTLLDLLMGLLEPSSGEIRVDGRALDAATRPLWQSQIAHVPQSIFLADDSIAANIAFGVRRGAIDIGRVRACAEAAHIAGFAAELPDGYSTRVGERGVRLSGGQRQRIGIARALYKEAAVLILDEATSALDDATEAAVIDSIMALGPDITLIMIAHRRSTLDGCERILRVENGRVTEEERPRRRSA